MKYTIITASYNAEKYIERLLATVLGQSYPNFEWIVQDGASSDNTLAVLQKYPDSRISVQSAPDIGVYDAWNKAVARATGDWAIFLGADDYFADAHALAKYHRYIKKLEQYVDFAYGGVFRVTGDRVNSITNISKRELYARLVRAVGLPFPATFIRVSLLKAHRFASEKYRIAGDLEFCLRHVTYNNVVRLPVCCVAMEGGGISANPTECRHMDEVGRALHEVSVPRADDFMRAYLENFWDRDETLDE